ncbi:hypothetical protein SVAN01_12017, partial [Stagonosporopsis vannaccii]
MLAPALAAPKATRSAHEPSEFPFHSPPSSLHHGPPTDDFDAIDHAVPRAAPKPASHASNGSTSSYYPPFAPVSRIPTADGEPADPSAPKERKSVQFARAATYGSDAPADDRARARARDDSSLMGKLRALAAPMQGHGRTNSNSNSNTNTNTNANANTTTNTHT